KIRLCAPVIVLLEIDEPQIQQHALLPRAQSQCALVNLDRPRVAQCARIDHAEVAHCPDVPGFRLQNLAETDLRGCVVAFPERCRRAFEDFLRRSEEHTSELQSRFDLVCRLLLEKKKKNKKMCVYLLHCNN